MDFDFLTRLNNRKFKYVGEIRAVKIIDRSENLFNNLLEEVLDQLYIERLLEDGKCIVCQVKTSICCSNCGTHYCSAACQRHDWHNHKMTCLVSQSRSTTDSLRKPAQFGNTSIDNVNDDGNRNLNSRVYRKTDTKLETSSDSRYSSIQDISDFGVGSTRDDESDADTNTNSSKGHNRAVRPANFRKHMKFKPKKFDNRHKNRNETKDTNSEGKENKMKFYPRNIVPGQKLTVKRMSQHKNNYWVINKRDAEKFERIQNRLQCEWKNFAAMSEPIKGLCAFKYNQKWHRCKVLGEGEKTLLRCVDTGHVFCPKRIEALELPDELKAEKGLAFDVCFKDSVLPEENVEWLDVQVLSILPRGVCLVKLCEKKQPETKKVDVEVGKVSEEKPTEPKKEEVESSEGEGKKRRNKNRNKKKKEKEDEDVNGGEKLEEEVPEKEETKPRKSVFDELKPTLKGVFLPAKIGKEELLGCLVPEDDEAISCYNKLKGLYTTDGNPTNANVGDDVLVADEDGIGQRGIVKLKSGDTYKVQLVDYGYTVQTNKVFRLPGKTADMIHFASRVTLLDDSPRRYDDFEVKRAYEFEVKEKQEKGGWLCKFSVYPDLKKTFACGIVDSPWRRRERNYVPFENGCEVVLIGVGPTNSVYIKHDDGNWDELLEKLNLKLNQYVMDTVSDLGINDVEIGDIVLCQYKQDELWYRARVLHKMKHLVRVVFVDYGNMQNSPQTDLRRMPEDVDEPFFSRRVTLVGPTDTFSVCGKEILNTIRKENLTLTLKYHGEDISEGVILFDEDGTNINKIAYGEEETTSEDDSSNPDFDKEKFLKPEGFDVGVVDNFVCLYIDKDSFRKHGIFWAVNPESSNFKYVIELDSKLSKHCESNSETISPETGILCIAEYQGTWYRGVIVDTFGPLFEVFFVDFGNSQIISKEFIRAMVPEFFQVPATAVKCFANGFDKLNAAGISRVESFISDNLNKPLKNTAKVVKVVDDGHYIEFSTM